MMSQSLHGRCGVRCIDVDASTSKAYAFGNAMQIAILAAVLGIFRSDFGYMNAHLC
jgi:hypothetical protein